MARPSKFTEERRQRFLVALAAGAFPETAARHAGWSPASFYRIMAGDRPEQRAFREEVGRTLTELELRLVGTVTIAALEDARLALTLLERRFGERWGRRSDPGREPAEAARTRHDEVIELDPVYVDLVVPKLLAARAGPAGTDPARITKFESAGGREEHES